jgi:KipI family sensor histidine kinase inhibitor
LEITDIREKNALLNRPTLRPVAEDGILVEYEEEVHPEINKKVRQLAQTIEKHAPSGLNEVIPAYRSLMVFFDPFQIKIEAMLDLITHFVEGAVVDEPLPPRLFRIPTVYGGEYGPDLERISRLKQLSPEEVIGLFSSVNYLVYCLGFLCSLAYLGGVPEILDVPRLTSPRPFIPVGSVGYSGRQANILPIDQPSGFNYIGRAFVKVYDPRNFPPTLFRPGDYIQCLSVSEEEAKKAGEKDLGDFIESL